MNVDLTYDELVILIKYYEDAAKSSADDGNLDQAEQEIERMKFLQQKGAG